MTERHVERFTGRVEDYARYRSRYSAEVLEVLRAECGLTPKSVIADVGAGTGMLAELFLENGNRVFAVEPNAEMRAVCEALAGRFSGLTVIDGVGEATGLEGGSVDFVAVGRAFHWFDRERALREFRRVLREAGWVVLVSVGRPHRGGDQVEAFEQVLMKHGVDYAARREGYRLYDTMPPLFEGATVRTTIGGERLEGWEELLGQVRSLSVMPRVGDAGYVGMVDGLREFFERYSEGGILRVETVCSLMACQVV